MASEFLTKKIGPLPAWAYLIAAAGVVYVLKGGRKAEAGGAGGKQQQTTKVQTVPVPRPYPVPKPYPVAVPVSQPVQGPAKQPVNAPAYTYDAVGYQKGLSGPFFVGRGGKMVQLTAGEIAKLRPGQIIYRRARIHYGTVSGEVG